MLTDWGWLILIFLVGINVGMAIMRWVYKPYRGAVDELLAELEREREWKRRNR